MLASGIQVLTQNVSVNFPIAEVFSVSILSIFLFYSLSKKYRSKIELSSTKSIINRASNSIGTYSSCY